MVPPAIPVIVARIIIPTMSALCSIALMPLLQRKPLFQIDPILRGLIELMMIVQSNTN